MARRAGQGSQVLHTALPDVGHGHTAGHRHLFDHPVQHSQVTVGRRFQVLAQGAQGARHGLGTRVSDPIQQRPVERAEPIQIAARTLSLGDGAHPERQPPAQALAAQPREPDVIGAHSHNHPIRPVLAQGAVDSRQQRLQRVARTTGIDHPPGKPGLTLLQGGRDPLHIALAAGALCQAIADEEIDRRLC
jgi:hypothetical protein